MSVSDLLRRLFGGRDFATSGSARPSHPYEGGHELQVGYLGKKARAREAEPAHKHHAHGSDKR